MDLLFLLRVTLCIAICIGNRFRAAADAVDIVTGWRSAHPEQFKKLRITRGPTQKRTQVMQAPLTKKAKNRTRTTGKGRCVGSASSCRKKSPASAPRVRHAVAIPLEGARQHAGQSHFAVGQRVFGQRL